MGRWNGLAVASGTVRLGDPLRVGVVMLQGARSEHAQQLIMAGEELGVEVTVMPLRAGAEWASARVEVVVVPGGESTTMRRAGLRPGGVLGPLFDGLAADPDLPAMGTCAGCILLADPGDAWPAFVDVHVERNGFGRQADSFEGVLEVGLPTPEVVSEAVPREAELAGEVVTPLLVMGERAPTPEHMPGVFIRAPRITGVGKQARAVVHHGGEVVGAVQGRRLVLTCHPELTDDRRLHRWLLQQVLERRAVA